MNEADCLGCFRIKIARLNHLREFGNSRTLKFPDSELLIVRANCWFPGGNRFRKVYRYLFETILTYLCSKYRKDELNRHIELAIRRETHDI